MSEMEFPWSKSLSLLYWEHNERLDSSIAPLNSCVFADTGFYAIFISRQYSRNAPLLCSISHRIVRGVTFQLMWTRRSTRTCYDKLGLLKWSNSNQPVARPMNFNNRSPSIVIIWTARWHCKSSIGGEPPTIAFGASGNDNWKRQLAATETISGRIWLSHRSADFR